MTTGEKDAILVAKARAGTITSAELRQVSHFSVHRIDSYNIAHLSQEDHAWLSDETCEANARFSDYCGFDDGGDEEE